MVVSQVLHNSKYIASKLTMYILNKKTLVVVVIWAHRPGSSFPSSCCIVLHCHLPSSHRPVDSSSCPIGPFFCLLCPSSPHRSISQSPRCCIVTPFGVVVALSLSSRFAVVPVPTLLAAVGPGAGWRVPSLPRRHPLSLFCAVVSFLLPPAVLSLSLSIVNIDTYKTLLVKKRKKQDK